MREKFYVALIPVFGEEYLRKPNQADVDRLLQVIEANNFPNMLRCIDCMHWEWKNYLAEWKGAFQEGFYKVPTIIHEAVTSHNTWI